MPNNNDLINLVNNKKPVELVQELKDYEIKKSPLSVAARSKVISKIGSDYVSGNKGDYGPGWKEFDRMESSIWKDEKLCQKYNCYEPKKRGDDKYCGEHREKHEEDVRFAKWVGKTSLGIGVSATLGPVGSLVTGGVGWFGGKIGEANSSSESVRGFWSSVSNFGGDMAKGELAGGLWGIGGSEMAKEIGVSASKGYKAGEFSYSVYSTSEELIIHQKHLDQGESYKSICKVCNL